MFFKDAQHIYRARPLEEFLWLEHGFGTRRTTAWWKDPSLVSLRQLHSDVCVYADGRAGRIGEGDALLTDTPGALLSVRTADCLPILIVDERRRAVAAVHAGWVGTVRRIAVKTLAAMQDRFSTRPKDLHVAIGPGIGACCYEVGPEVATQFQDQFPERSDLTTRTRIDLAEANRRQLLEAGVPSWRVYTAARCTCCGEEEFHSFRRDRRSAGRMISVIRIRN